MVRAQYPHMQTKLIAAMLGRTLTTVYQRAQMMGLAKTPEYFATPASGRTNGRQGVGFRFAKGHVPANKGLRRPGWGPGRMKETQFKKGGALHGTAAHNWKPVGSMRRNNDGYLDVKWDQKRKGASAWVAVHRLNWIGVHGPIPKGYFLRFKDGNKNNPLVSNLELVTRAEHLYRNYHGRYPLEVRRLVQLRGALQRQINRRENHGQQDRGLEGNPVRHAAGSARQGKAHGDRTGKGRRGSGARVGGEREG